MEYPVSILGSREELAACPVFSVDHFQWTCRVRPETTGRMGYLPGEGLLVWMECRGRDPRRVYQNPQDPVCRDSAMEAFFTFCETPHNDCMYLNFELNANGAMHAKYGAGRKNRTPLSPEEYAACRPRARVGEEAWEIGLTVPLPLLQKLYGLGELTPGDRFWCNFYKISESADIEHYASYSPVGSGTPNFHLPEFFAPAAIK